MSTDRVISVLDHGYVKLIETWGSDESVVAAARMSTDGAFRGWGDWKPCDYCLGDGYELSDGKIDCHVCAGKCGTGTKGDEKLLRFLWENGHTSPFEQSGLVVEVQVPLFVERQWQRHRTLQWFSVNELSGRYTKLPEETYVPWESRLAIGGQSKSNKQASGVALDDETVKAARAVFRRSVERSQEDYRELLALGVARELARGVLTVDQYTRMRICGSLWNWTRFLSKRLPEDVQWETRQFATAISKLVAERFPRTWALFAES